MKFSHIMILYSEEKKEKKKKKWTFQPPRLLTDKTVDRERENKKLQQRQQTRGIERKNCFSVCGWVKKNEMMTLIIKTTTTTTTTSTTSTTSTTNDTCT